MNICFQIIHNEDSHSLQEVKGNPSSPIEAFSTQASLPLQPSPFQRRAVPPKKRNLKQNHYNWNETENRRYITFLSKNGDILKLPTEQKKKMRVNILMAKAVQSRNSTQCHTHHQKMMEKYQSIEEIIQNFSYLLKPNKKSAKKITAAIQPIVEPEENLMMVQLEEEFARTSFFKEYISPVVIDPQMQLEYIDDCWQF